MTFSPMRLRIETERLVLTPEEPSDAEWFTELLNSRGTGSFTVAAALERIAGMTKTIETTGIGALVLRKRPDGSLSAPSRTFSEAAVAAAALRRPFVLEFRWLRRIGP
jgi:hypothetical protein